MSERETTYHPVISLEARMDYIDEMFVAQLPSTIGRIALSLGTYENKVIRLVDEMGIEPIDAPKGSYGNEYPEWANAVIEEELHWRDTLRDLPDKVELTLAAEVLTVPIDWVEDSVRRLEEKAGKFRKNKVSNQKTTKTMVNKLRALAMETPYNEDGYTFEALQELSGMDAGELSQALAGAAITADYRKSPVSREIDSYYDGDVLSYLLERRLDIAS